MSTQTIRPHRHGNIQGLPDRARHRSRPCNPRAATARNQAANTGKTQTAKPATARRR
jgi:hypothetical protein